MSKLLKAILILLIFSFNHAYGQKLENKEIVKYQKRDTLHKYLENFVNKYVTYDCKRFPILIIDSDTTKIDGKNFLNVKFSSYSGFVNLIVCNRSDIFLPDEEILGRKVVIRVNVGRDMLIDPLEIYLNNIEAENKKYHILLIKMIDKRIKDLRSGICLGIETEKYSPEMDLIFDKNSDIVNIVYRDESNNSILKNMRRLGVKYEL